MKIAKMILFFVGLSIFQAFGMEPGLDRTDALSITSQNSEEGESLPLPQWQRPSDEFLSKARSVVEEKLQSPPLVRSHHNESSLSSVSAAGDKLTQIMRINYANIVQINKSIENKDLEELEFHLETSDNKSIYDMWASAYNVRIIILPFANVLHLASISGSAEDKDLYFAMGKMLLDYEKRHNNHLQVICQDYAQSMITQATKMDLASLVFLADMGIAKAIEAIQEIHCRN